MSDAKLLIVEDESKLNELLKRTFADHFEVTSFTSYNELEDAMKLASMPYDLIVLDRMMDGHDTLGLVPRLKEKFPQCKILVLSAINTPVEKAMALDLGADDYLSKPFAAEELMARARVVARRISNEIRFGNISVNTLDRTATVGEQPVSLSNKEFLLLRTFIQFPGKVFSKSHLYEQVWQTSADVESNAIETTVNKLRRKLEEASATAQIKNSRNLGYWLEE